MGYNIHSLILQERKIPDSKDSIYTYDLKTSQKFLVEKGGKGLFTREENNY